MSDSYGCASFATARRRIGGQDIPSSGVERALKRGARNVPGRCAAETSVSMRTAFDPDAVLSQPGACTPWLPAPLRRRGGAGYMSRNAIGWGIALGQSRVQLLCMLSGRAQRMLASALHTCQHVNRNTETTKDVPAIVAARLFCCDGGAGRTARGDASFEHVTPRREETASGLSSPCSVSCLACVSAVNIFNLPALYQRQVPWKTPRRNGTLEG